MKKTIIASLLLILSIGFTGAVQAASSCFCVGPNRAAGTCGNGGVAGNFSDVRKKIPDNLLKYLLLTQPLRNTLTSTGKAYDTQTGWACWKE